MTIEQLAAQYGLPAIFVGAGVEGETLVITGGALAQKHIIPFWAAVLAASSGSFFADQLFFLAGRHFRERRFVARTIRKPAFARAMALFERHPTGFILIFRFLYGLRTVSPIAIGTSHVRSRTFMLLNALAALLWGTLFTWIGFHFGERIVGMTHKIIPPQYLPLAVIGLILLLFAAARAISWLRHRHEEPKPV